MQRRVMGLPARFETRTGHDGAAHHQPDLAGQQAQRDVACKPALAQPHTINGHGSPVPASRRSASASPV